MKSKEEIIEEMQKVVEQMRLDDLADDPSSGDEYFDCDCCGKYQALAGSIQYGKYRLCNDCVLLAELGFELKKFQKIEELIDKMEDSRLGEMCEFIKKDQTSQNN